MSEWIEAASVSFGDRGFPGGPYAIIIATLSRCGDRWKCDVTNEWELKQSCAVECGHQTTEGRGSNPEDAIFKCREDVLAWAGNDEQKRAEHATLLRRLEYAAEDARLT